MTTWGAPPSGAGGSLWVVGTGFLVAGQVTPEAEACIRQADRLLDLVVDPVTRVWLRSLHPGAESLYTSYREGRHRRESYQEMTQRILAPVRRGERVCAAFYGHPGVFVNPAHAAIRLARAEGYPAAMLPGISAEDCLFADLEMDPTRHGCQSYEASDFLLNSRRHDPASLLILWQVGAIGVATFMNRDLWSREGLADLTRRLLRDYPPDHGIILYEAAQVPTCDPVIHPLPLAELPGAPVSLITTLCVPPLPGPAPDPRALEALGLPRPPAWPLSSRLEGLAAGTGGAGRGQSGRGRLWILGTGYGVAAQVTPETQALIRQADAVFYLVSDPATAEYLRGLHPGARSLHDCYREGRTGSDAAAEMVNRLTAPLARGEEVCAVFYGHPAIFVPPALLALEAARRAGHQAGMRPAVSAEDCLFAHLGVDPGPTGRCLYEATDFILHARRPDTASAVILLQAGAVGLTRYRARTSADPRGVRLLTEALRRHYPAHHPVTVFEIPTLPVLDPLVLETPLVRLPEAALSVSSTLYIPPLGKERGVPAEIPA